MKIPFTLLAAGLALLLAGCSTVSSRIDEKAAVFNSLDPQTQARIRQGLVDVGFTQDMVYMALGRPNSTREQQSSQGLQTTWVYNTYWQEYEGRQLVGYHRQAYFDERARAWRVYYQPVHANIYSEREEEYIRVMFKDGKVAAIEQTKD